MRNDQVAAPGWIVLNTTKLSEETGLTVRQLQYNLVKYFDVRSEGSGSFYEVRVEDMRVIRTSGRLVAAGFPMSRAIEVARFLGRADFVDLPGGIRVSLLEEKTW